MVKENLNNKNSKVLCDIIIITYNGLEYTKKCIESVEKFTKDVDYRIIFVDNNSTDGTVEFLKKIPNSVLIKNSDNVGFVKAMNQGFEKVTAMYTVWLNNDTIVTPDWLKFLIKHLEDNPDVAAIGPKTNGSGIMQKEESWEGSTDLENIAKFSREFYGKNRGKLFEYHRIAGFCIVMKSEMISRVGKLDERFNVGGYDDDDYCRRIRNEGFKILIASDVFIYHKSGATFSMARDPDFDLSYLMQKGRRNFLAKWVKEPQDKIESTKVEPLVSIVMATRNREKMITNAINSVVNQTYKNWELLVVNDGGIDLQKIIDGFEDSRIKYFNVKEHQGKSHANNLAIKNSKGEIIAYLDDDDRWRQNHLDVSVYELMKYECRNAVYTDYEQIECIVNESGKQFPIKKSVKEIKELRGLPLEEMNVIPNLAIIHKKSLIDLIGYYDEGLDYYEDWDYFRRMSRVTHFVHVPEITGEYWINKLQTARNASALLDANIHHVTNYIRSKSAPIQNEIIKLLIEADSKVKKSELENALKLYQKILENDPEFLPALEGCADRCLNTKNYDKGLEYAKKIQKLNPYYSNGHYLIAQIGVNSNEFEVAKKSLEYALIIKDDRIFYYLLQICYHSLGNEETAKSIKEKFSLVANNIGIDEIQEFLLALYNKSPFYRKLFIFGYKILKRIS
jgi:GT2 family glycosyltransferase